MEPVQPVLKEPAIAYLASYAAILAVASVITLPLPSPIRIPLIVLIGIFAAILVGLGLWGAAYVHFTEEYNIGDGQVIVKRGFFTRTGAAIPLRNIAEVQAVLPFPLRLLGVGVIRVSTNDGAVHLLHNVRRPVDFAESVRALLKG